MNTDPEYDRQQEEAIEAAIVREELDGPDVPKSWHIYRPLYGRLCILDAPLPALGVEVICTLPGTVLPGGEGCQMEANARLIAAAPDMLSALRGILANFHESVTTDAALAEFPALKAVADAIAKAEGR